MGDVEGTPLIFLNKTKMYVCQCLIAFMSNLNPCFNSLSLTELIYRDCVCPGNISTSKLSSLLLIEMLKINCFDFFWGGGWRNEKEPT